MTFFVIPSPAPQRLPHRFDTAIDLQGIDAFLKRRIGVIAEMLAELLLRLTGNGRLPSAKVHLRLQCPQVTMLARQLANHGPTYREPLRQPGVTPFVVFIRLHDPLAQIHR
jgi:hypothetical protein